MLRGEGELGTRVSSWAVRALSETMLEKGRTGLAEVWRQGRDGERCWNCFKLLATEETTFRDSLQRDKDVDRPMPRG